MARVHFVKKARKKNPVAKKGESYYWWEPMVGGRGGTKRFSKTRPKPSQLTQSDFFSTLYSAQEAFEDSKPATWSELQAAKETLISDLQNLSDETQDKLHNLPEQLQSGQPGELQQGRIDALESYISEIDAVDTDQGDGEEKDDDPDLEQAIQEILDLSCDAE